MDKKIQRKLDHALIKAAYSGNTEQVRLFIDAGADVSMSDPDGWTPLHWATAKGNIDCMRLLIDAGADINVKDHSGRTALHWAALRGNTEYMKALIEAGADTDARTNNDETAMDILERKYIRVYSKHIGELTAARPEAKRLSAEDAAGVSSGDTATGFDFDI